MAIKIPEWMRPFGDSILDGLAAAEIEQAFSRYGTIATMALQSSITINQLAFFGLFLQMVFLPDGVALDWERLWAAPWSWKIGFVVICYVVLLFTKYLANYLTRFVVMISGFSLSLGPGQLVRNYVYSATTKVYLFILMILGTGLMTYMWYEGMVGYLLFFSPHLVFNFPLRIVLAFALAYIVASIVFPATRVDVQDASELLQLLVVNDLTRSLHLQDRLRTEMVRLATPHLSAQLVATVREKGPTALADWLTVPPTQWDRMASALQFSSSALSGAAQVRYKLLDGQHHLAVTHNNGQTTIHTPQTIEG